MQEGWGSALWSVLWGRNQRRGKSLRWGLGDGGTVHHRARTTDIGPEVSSGAVRACIPTGARNFDQQILWNPITFSRPVYENCGPYSVTVGSTNSAGVPEQGVSTHNE